MVKAKKNKKDVLQEDISDNEIEQSDEIAQSTVPPSKEKTKKKKNTKSINKGSNDKDDDDSEIEELSKNIKAINVTTKNKEKKKKKKANSDDDDDAVSKKPQKSGFDLLMADLSDDDNNVPEQAPEPISDENEDIADTKKISKKSEQSAAGNKKGKKTKKKRNDSDEDIEKVLAELQMEYDGVKKPESTVTIESSSNDTKKSKKSKDDKISATPAVPADDEDNDAVDDTNETTGTVKTAAQKKKEKKERQKREAAQQKAQEKTAAATSTIIAEDAPGETESEPVPVSKKKASAAKKTKEVVLEQSLADGQTAIPDADEKEGSVEKTKDDKKSKKKSKADKKEEEKEKERTKKKGISSAMVAAMQERLAKVKEEEERLKREEEERIQREEEAENARLEKLRLEAERKEKKKQKEHERKARLKAEGKLLTAKQKQDKARAQAMLDNLRAQGVELPEIGEKRPVARLGTRVRNNKKKDALQQSTSQDDTVEQEKVDNDSESVQITNEEKAIEEAEKIKEAWDASSSEEEEESPPPPPSKSETKKSESPDSDSDDEDDEDESDDDDDSDEDDEDGSDDASGEESKPDAEVKREKAWERIMKRRHAAEEKRTVDNLRAAVVCVLGHVDTGKTKILDKLRRTNVQDCEAGGITQQIGATNVPIENIKEQTRIVKGFTDITFKLPGLLIIDTPGHESFSNLRNRGSSLCDIAILVVDIMHGLEPQTIESINLLKSKKTPFVVALNKIDRLYNWQTQIRKDIRETLKIQAQNTQLEFEQRTKEVIVQFAEQGLNAALFYDNPDPRTYVNLVPTSAITGEGMGNLLFLIVESCQSWLAKRLMYSEELLATVLEVKAIPGLGTTIDAILINGKLREGETMVIAGTDGPIVTQIRSLLMPQPMKELRVKNAYIEHKEIIAAQGVKIAAKELEKAIAGLNLYVAHKPDEVDICRDEVAKELKSALSHIKLTSEGVYVQASTLGSLEALLEFLKTSKIPYANIRIGPVVKRDVMKASTMLAHDSQYATILAFDVKIERDAQDLADSLGVKIFQADIIYHLFDQFTAYRDELKRKKREEFRSIAVFPCKLKILPQFIFNSRDPIVIGVMIEGGILKEGTPICVPSKEFLDIGIVTSIECNHKQVESARKGQEVCVKIEPIPGESPKMYGRHFEETDMLTSKISRQSIDACKDYFRDDLVKADWALMVELKKLFQIL